MLHEALCAFVSLEGVGADAVAAALRVARARDARRFLLRRAPARINALALRLFYDWGALAPPHGVARAATAAAAAAAPPRLDVSSWAARFGAAARTPVEGVLAGGVAAVLAAVRAAEDALALPHLFVGEGAAGVLPAAPAAGAPPAAPDADALTCARCGSGDAEDLLVLCDACDVGTHTL